MPAEACLGKDSILASSFPHLECFRGFCPVGNLNVPFAKSFRRTCHSAGVKPTFGILGETAEALGLTVGQVARSRLGRKCAHAQARVNGWFMRACGAGA